jgi:hypothetical protein
MVHDSLNKLDFEWWNGSHGGTKIRIEGLDLTMLKFYWKLRSQKC